MNHLLDSRMSRDESPSRLENLSPLKYGKAAFASLTFTPSKLVDNVLYKEATTFKKVEDESSKVRQSEATISILKDRLDQSQEERNGIESTLSQQIIMYKKMLHDNEGKHEQRVNNIQLSFNEEMQRLVVSKEEEAKYSQSEKELFETRITELEAELGSLTDKLNHGGSNFDELTKEHQKLEIHYKNVCQKLEQTESKLNEEKEKGKADHEELSRKLYNSQVDFKGQIDKLQLDREREKESLDRLHRTQLEKNENRRIQEAQLKNQELKQLNDTFNAELGRMSDTVNAKERSIDNLTASLGNEKDKILELTRNTTSEITNLVHDKSRLKEEIDNLSYEVAGCKDERVRFQEAADRSINSLKVQISHLKEELEINQVNSIREKDKYALVIDDLHREVIALQTGAEKVGNVMSENSMLCREIRNLKDLLLESSLEMEKCKEEFLRIGREKDHLVVQVRELGFQNQTLHRMKFEKDEEAKGWRQNYYLNRR